MIERRSVMSLGISLAALLASGSGRGAAAQLPSGLTKFQASLKGRLLMPSNVDYEAARRVGSFNPRTDRHPLMIVRCADASDVSRTLEFASHAGLDVSVKAGGNDVLGESVCNGGVVIDLSQMRDIAIDHRTSIARLGAGVMARQLNVASEAHGLAPVLACYPELGVSGLTLGGGLGWLTGTYGAACDHLVGAEIVCANGNVLRATADENTDLFWALKGGGGNFGVVTRLALRLAPVTQVLGGPIVFQCDIAKFLRFYRDFMHAAPDGLTIELNIFPIDKPVVMAFVCWNGDQARGERVLQPLRDLEGLVHDSIQPVSYAHLTDRPGLMQLVWTALSDVFTHPSLVAKAVTSMAAGGPPPQYLYWRGGSIEELGEKAISQLATIAQSVPQGGSIGLGHFMHGAISKVENGATPLVRRTGAFTYFVGARWGAPPQAEASMKWVDGAVSAMRQLSIAGTYVNYLSDNSEQAVAAAYGENYSRLVSLKRKYDPKNVFRHNRNIRP